ncbi:MAG: bifunctional folylpolyglutamate synthase/dihydrofolate synthase [Firmicutes bacterium]|nr:bifunctional folylpolyglutamate synthase/dihydrofolate synthase [Bacillota bacterium]
MAISDGLDRMEALLKELGNPEKDFKAIHIAGTNGKGSTAVMTASVLEEAGYSVGLFTSPYLETECERMQIWDGTHRMIEQEVLDALREKVMAAGEEVKKALNIVEPTFFEVYTAAAYLWFREQAPDYVVLETGLGGRLDSTNTLERPLVTVITQIGLDHTSELGDTVTKIAREKAGIIKPGVPVVSQTDVMMIKNVIRRIAAEKGAEFIDVSRIYSDKRSMEARHIPLLAMHGAHQLRNAATAAEAIRAAGIEVSDEAVEKGLAKAFLPGRFEILNKEGDKGPLFIIDGAHNPDAIEAMTRTHTVFARAYKIKRTLVIFGCMKDKNSVRMIQLMTGGLKGCSYAATAVDNERAEDPLRIGELIAECGRSCDAFGSVREAYEYARDSSFECVLTCGSIYLAGEMRELYNSDHN